MRQKGVVYCSTGSHYRVKFNGAFYDCRIKGKFRIKGIKSTNPIAVGDRVWFDRESDGVKKTGVITENTLGYFFPNFFSDMLANCSYKGMAVS